MLEGFIISLHQLSTVRRNCQILSLPQEKDVRGKLTYLEEENHVPFQIRRAFFIYDVPSEKVVRGEHAHRETEQVLIPLQGSFKLFVKTREESETYELDDPTTGLYVPPKTWTELKEFSDDAVVMVLASTYYDPEEYINDYEELTSLLEETD